MRFPPFDTYGMDDHEVLLPKDTRGALSNNYKGRQLAEFACYMSVI